MSWDFKPGMRVVLIRPYTSPDYLITADAYGLTLPREGVVYTIRGVFPPQPVADGSGSALPLLLNEIVNPAVEYPDGKVSEPSWASTRFRPVDETRLDVFRNLLVDLPKEEELA